MRHLGVGAVKTYSDPLTYFHDLRFCFDVKSLFTVTACYCAGHIVTTAYKLPRGAWFDKLNVSAPHYLAEIIVHVSVGVALGMRSSTWWLLTGYLLLNHIQLAADKQRFYRQKFDEFPKDRKMLIPKIL